MPDQRLEKQSWAYGGVGILLLVAAIFTIDSIPFLGVFLLLFGFGLFFVGVVFSVRSKGYHWSVGFIAFLGVIGLIILMLLPDKAPTRKKKRGKKKRRRVRVSDDEYDF